MEMGLNYFEINKLTYVEINDLIKGAVAVEKQRATMTKMKSKHR